MILGTAGHIDHGKTALVRALTGVDTDRLPEEKRRGITIELGFAPLMLEGVGQIGVVDVPGHEAFVRTMVAGATGIDMALVVVAADSGVMPQTREHLAILELLGVRAGVVAVTKVDLVEPEWLALVEEDVRATLAGTALDGCEIVPVSSVTGAGIDELRRALANIARTIPMRAFDDLFRLPIDRAFTVKGTGTVVTGTVWSGSLVRETPVRLLPGDVVARVRAVQAHGHAVDAVHAGDRAAIALAGLELDAVHRGMMLVQGDAWRASRVLRADVTLLEAAPSIANRTRVRFHLGTSDVGARLVLGTHFDDASGRRPARVVLDDPVVARTGDRFVLRSPSPSLTLGGGVVTDPLAPPRARPSVGEARDPFALLHAFTAEAGTSGVDIKSLPVRLGRTPHQTEAIVAETGAWRVGQRLLSRTLRDRLASLALATVELFHSSHPLESGAPLQWLRSKLDAPDEIASALLVELAEDGTLVVNAGLVGRAGFTATLGAAHAALRDGMLAMLVKADKEPPSFDELAISLSASADDVGKVARWLVTERNAVPVEPHRFYSTEAVERLRGLLSSGMEAEREYGPGDLRDLLGLTRKFLIPFLEYCDREGYTVRGITGKRRLGT